MGEKRPGKKSVYSGCWHIPGGAVEQGESREQALRRELKEETGMDISAYKVRLIDDKGSGEAVKRINGQDTPVKMRFLVYEVLADGKADDMDLSEDDDLINLHWFSPGELTKVELAPPSIPLFERLGYM